MKKLFKTGTIVLCAIVTIGLTSCGKKQLTRDDIVKQNAEEYIKSKMNDPNSYEYVKLELIDSVLYSDNIEYRKDYFKHNIEYNQSSIEQQESYKTELPSLYDEQEIKDLNAEIEKSKRILSKIDSIEAQMGDKKNEVASFTYIFSFRGNNALGAKVMNEYIIQTTSAPDFKIINMTNDKNKVLLNPNGFPGYKEMIKENL
ncbi:MAG TPA: hypothetical protein PLS09_04020 [Paludibacteraceae bacterium]|jgi:hypothetical protein|nr:hypothetical protein [Paludibacteraceae bacterium]